MQELYTDFTARDRDVVSPRHGLQIEQNSAKSRGLLKKSNTGVAVDRATPYNLRKMRENERYSPKELKRIEKKCKAAKRSNKRSK